MKIKPNLQFSVLCDDVRREDNGKFMLIGLFEAINAKKFPATHQVLFVVNRWCKGSGTFTQKIRIVNPKDNSSIFQTDEEMASTAEELSSQAEQLQGSVAFFKIVGGQLTRPTQTMPQRPNAPPKKAS